MGRMANCEILYEKNPEVTLQELMENTNAQEIFSQSKYKPKG